MTPPHRAMSTTACCSTSRCFWSSSSRVIVVGWAWGISTTDVIPPAAAPAPPDANPSSRRGSGSSKWVWVSMPPGMSQSPVASMRSGADQSLASSVSAAIRSSTMTTSAGNTPPSVTTVPFSMMTSARAMPCSPASVPGLTPRGSPRNDTRPPEMRQTGLPCDGRFQELNGGADSLTAPGAVHRLSDMTGAAAESRMGMTESRDEAA